MRLMSLLITVATVIFFSGCIRNPQGVTHSQIIAARAVLGGVSKNDQNLFSVLTSLSSVTQASSQLQKDSSLARFKDQSQLQQSRFPLAWQKELSTMTRPCTKRALSGEKTLIISDGINQAWIKVEHALQKTSYQIMDQDRSLSSFYILDTKSTNDLITKSTQMYRIYLKSQGHQTQVALLNRNDQPAAKNITQRILLAIQQQVT